MSAMGGISGLVILNLSSSRFDPGCVKTHTSEKCRKYNSPTRYRAESAQMIWLHDVQICGDVSTSAAHIGVLTRPRPTAVIRWRCARIRVSDFMEYVPAGSLRLDV